MGSEVLKEKVSKDREQKDTPSQIGLLPLSEGNSC